MSYILLLVYFLLCGVSFIAYRILYKNRYFPYYELDKTEETDDETYAIYEVEERFKKYIDNYSIYTKNENKFFRVQLTDKVEYINFNLICFKNKKIYKICNVLHELRDTKENYTIRLPENCEGVKLLINEANGEVFENKPLIKTDLLWRAILSSIIIGIPTFLLIYVLRLIFIPSTNEFFEWDSIYQYLFFEPWNYFIAISLTVFVSAIFFVILYFPNLAKLKKAKFNAVLKYKINRIIKIKDTTPYKDSPQFIRFKIKKRKKFKRAKLLVTIFNIDNEIIEEKEVIINKKRKKVAIEAKGQPARFNVKVVSAEFKKMFYEFEKFRRKQTKNGISSNFKALKGLVPVTFIFCIAIGLTTGYTFFEFNKIYQINNNLKHFEFDDEGSTFAITDYSGENTVIAIPTTYLGKKVRAVGNGAFYLNTYIEELIIPSGIEIGSSAFANCKWLKKVEFSPDTIIGNNAFSGSHIRHLDLSANQVIGNGAFINNSYLKSVKLGGSITLGNFAFQDTNIDYLEVFPSDFNLDKSVFYKSFVKEGYIYKGNGSSFTSFDVPGIFASGSNVKVEMDCVHDKNSFAYINGKMIKSYSYTDYQIILESTCISRGTKEVVCNYCGAHYYVSTKIQPNKHTFVDGVCIHCNLVDPNYEGG